MSVAILFEKCSAQSRSLLSSVDRLYYNEKFPVHFISHSCDVKGCHCYHLVSVGRTLCSIATTEHRFLILQLRSYFLTHVLHAAKSETELCSLDFLVVSVSQTSTKESTETSFETKRNYTTQRCDIIVVYYVPR
jgi:hypothetical protein